VGWGHFWGVIGGVPPPTPPNLGFHHGDSQRTIINSPASIFSYNKAAKLDINL
jgi:hypothetical protein